MRVRDLRAEDLLIMKAGWSEVEMEECGTMVDVAFGAAWAQAASVIGCCNLDGPKRRAVFDVV